MPDDLPLLDLFDRLRDAGVQLGTEDYLLFLRALQAGFGLTDRTALARLCRTLWIKSPEDLLIFGRYFDELAPQVYDVPRDPEQLQFPTQPEPVPDSFIPPLVSESESPPPSTTEETLPETESAEAVEPLTPTEVKPILSASIETPGKHEYALKIEDEVQAAQAVRAEFMDIDLSPSRFKQTTEYFPVTRRQMKQTWRHLRRMIREGSARELDVEATVNAIGRHGRLLELVFASPRVNRAELLLLMDLNGSMTPFHALAQRLIETAQRGGQLRKTRALYFHNVPSKHLYITPGLHESQPLERVLGQMNPRRTGTLIFSDAGAARGGFDPGRIELTAEFLDLLKQQMQYVAWLNPMPRVRWRGTTASEIARLIPMFEMTRRGMDCAIDILRGRHFHLAEGAA